MDLRKIKKEFDKVKADRSNFNVMYQVLGEYVHQMKQNFEGTPANGEFLTKEIYDATGAFAASNAASAILGMLWPGTAGQAVEIAPPDGLELSTSLSTFYERMNEKASAAIDDQKAGLSVALDEYMLDQMVFGTSGVGVEKGKETKLIFSPYGVQEMYIQEGKGGKVNKLWLFFEWNVDRVVGEYGIDNVSEKTKKAFEEGGGDKKVCILHAIRPRMEKKAKKGKLAMPYESVHMEYESCHLLKEDGFHEFPIPVSRFRKLNYETMGRSPAMNALPDIREANILREAIIVATEKNLDPPLGVLSDGMLGGGVIDTSSGAINVFNASANISGGNPVFPLVTVGSLADAMARLETLGNSISQHFFIDRLLDFNNETQMTFGEAQIREARSNASMTSIFARQLAFLHELMERAIAILWREGEFGVVKGSEEEAEILALGLEPEYVPDEIAERLANGDDIYKLVFKSKAANAAKAEEYISIIDVTNYALQAMQVDQSLAARVNMHAAIKHMGSIRGLPADIIRKDDEVNEILQKQQQQQEAMMAVEAGEKVAGAADKLASAEQRASANEAV